MTKKLLCIDYSLISQSESALKYFQTLLDEIEKYHIKDLKIGIIYTLPVAPRQGVTNPQSEALHEAAKLLGKPIDFICLNELLHIFNKKELFSTKTRFQVAPVNSLYPLELTVINHYQENDLSIEKVLSAVPSMSVTEMFKKINKLKSASSVDLTLVPPSDDFERIVREFCLGSTSLGAVPQKEVPDPDEKITKEAVEESRAQCEPPFTVSTIADATLELEPVYLAEVVDEGDDATSKNGLTLHQMRENLQRFGTYYPEKKPFPPDVSGGATKSAEATPVDVGKQRKRLKKSFQ
ncbi:MAG: hypothetical protein ACHQJ6_03535 [Candidatus Berkiellales bacterium]